MGHSNHRIKRITIKDVAQAAGVSIATVSRILNGQSGVSPALIAQVQLAVAELDYQPNAVARALKVQESRSLGLIIPDIENPFFPALVRGVEDYAQEKGYALILCNTDGHSEEEAKYIKFLLSKQVDGILCVANLSFAEHGEWLKQVSVPIVLVDRRIPGAPFSTVLVDNMLGAAMAVEHLIQQGRKHIAMIGGKIQSPTNLERTDGYRQALMLHGLPYLNELVINADFTFEGGFAAGKALIAGGKHFDAVFAANDMMAIGVIECLAQHHVQVPEDVAVVGFDNIRMAGWYKPALSTISQPVYEMGQIAAKMVLEQMLDGTVAAQTVMLTPELIVRQSSLRKE
ncbi:LacI family DNA-binding transcriptional regulator [bacterium BFN5]|nr:LacI family DNA-binding transcriptional regulator [bacterium BFN5]QJW46034.1 LacI family DNA-binding transcriptional regulator [bacterium BFN5]